MIRKLAFASAGFIAAAGGANAMAACATLVVSPATPSLPVWNPLNPAPQEATFTATLKRTANDSQRVRLIFVDANNSDPILRVENNTGPKYEVVDASSVKFSYPQGTIITGLGTPQTAEFNNQGNAVFNLRLRILANENSIEDFVGGTTFKEVLRYSARCFKNNSENGLDDQVTSNLEVSLTIPKLASIVTAGPATINFQNFTTTTQEATISVKSTSSLNVSVANRNSNASKLALGGTATADNATIPYTMQFGKASGVLSTIAPNAPLSGVTRAGVGSSNYDLKLTLPNGIPSGKLPGTYSDQITLTITPGA